MEPTHTESWKFKPLNTMFTNSRLDFRTGDILYSDPLIRTESWAESLKREWQGVQVVERTAVGVAYKMISCTNGTVSVGDTVHADQRSFLDLLERGTITS